jgi:hypothetical protein
MVRRAEREAVKRANYALVERRIGTYDLRSETRRRNEGKDAVSRLKGVWDQWARDRQEIYDIMLDEDLDVNAIPKLLWRFISRSAHRADDPPSPD